MSEGKDADTLAQAYEQAINDYRKFHCPERYVQEQEEDGDLRKRQQQQQSQEEEEEEEDLSNLDNFTYDEPNDGYSNGNCSNGGNNGDEEDENYEDEPFEEIELFNANKPAPKKKKQKAENPKSETQTAMEQYPFWSTCPWNWTGSQFNSSSQSLQSDCHACCSCCHCSHRSHRRRSHSRHHHCHRSRSPRSHKKRVSEEEDENESERGPGSCPRPPPLDGVTPELQSLLTSWFNAGYEMGVYHERQRRNQKK